MHQTTDRLLRRARALNHAIHSYYGNGGAPRIDDVAIIVTCEEYADITGDPFLTAAGGAASFGFGFGFDYPTELRLYGILVLPR
jgi:hypothetical protein